MAYQNSTSNRNRSARPSGNRPGVRSFRPGKGPRTGGSKQRRGAYIHPSKFINKATILPGEEAPYEPTHLFTDFNFVPALQKNIDHKGYVKPSAIQD